MNRRLPLVVALLVIQASCSSTYRVKREDLARVPGTIPAIAEDGRETWISTERVKNPRETELPAWVDVDVSDTRKTLISTGGGIALYGLIGVGVGFAMKRSASRPGREPFENVGDGIMWLPVVALSSAITLTGGSLVLAGFLTGPPDQPAPQAEVATAPPRR